MNNSSVFIIAEAGVNHNGDIALAKKLIDAAAEAGVDAVKFQTWKTELLVTPDAVQAEYQTENTGKEESQFAMLKRLELSYPEFEALKSYCEQKNIRFLSTPDEAVSAQFLNNLQDIFKIGSGELTNIPYLAFIARLGKTVILSTGMGDMEEIHTAVRTLKENGLENHQIKILHATTEYPTPMEEVNLRAMLQIQRETGLEVGYSDHTLGIEVPVAAVALGAKVIEKHFTLDKNMEGPDHRASLDPQELKAMVVAIRNVEKALSGSGIKEPTPSEMKNKPIVRKSIVAGRSIKAGEVLSEENLAIKRPGTGISPMKWAEVIGNKAIRDFEPDEMIVL